MPIRLLLRRPVLAAALALAVVIPALSPTVAQGDELTPGTRPSSRSARSLVADTGGLQVVVNERGRISRSIGGIGTSTDSEFVITKPAGATVRSAYLATATTGFTGSRLADPILLGGAPVPITGEVANGISSYNYFADVTSMVRATIDAAPAGPVSLNYAEPLSANVDGSILEVVFDDPAVTTDQSVTILYGALKPTGDTYRVNLTSPVKPNDPSTRLEMSLGISYSYQSGGTQQYSTVDVNGRRLTSAAGGEDDGRPSNGSLLTVGGDGDSSANPADPDAAPTTAGSDDELYDLRPFVRDGDTQIEVATENPSRDDNVFLATFTMNPPVSTVSTGDDFVYVALGDSYQSGEGAGMDLRPSSTYLATGFENGSNAASTVGAQENTYTDGAQGSSVQGNSCHRALLNYAKLNRDRLEPGQNVLLVDRTCSGAQIEPDGGKPPIVGKQGGGIDPTSQVQQALDRLRAEGRSAADVDLVTVGMGGNDAGFGKIVSACVGPALLESLLRKYPNSPGEISWLSQQATCARVDGWFVKSGDALKTLQAKEEDAQRNIKRAFPNARVLNNDYPNILPAHDAPSWCGGLRGSDVDYAKQRIIDINARIKSAARNTGTEVVDSENTFGANALCPGASSRKLANGIDQANFNREVTRLLNVDGKGDATSRRLLDDLVKAYSDFKGCLANKSNIFDGKDCDLGAAKEKVLAKAQLVLQYLDQNNAVIFGNIVSPPGTTDDSRAVAFDRSRNLFHPNAAGFAVQACSVLNVYQGRAVSDGCGSGGSTKPSRGRQPVVLSAGDLLKLIVEYFQARSQVRLVLFSDEVDLGTVTADEEGTVNTEVKIPALNPGVHRLELQGVGADGTQVTQEILVRIDGRPSGSYTTYLTGFENRPTSPVADAPIETVSASLNGVPFGEFQVDEYGGALISVPSVDQLTSNAPIKVTAISSLTGKQVAETVKPVPTTPSLWALDRKGAGVTVLGARFAANGLLHSEAGVVVAGARGRLTGGVEYATSYLERGTDIVVSPRPVKVAAGQGAPDLADIADYRPGGAVASSGVPYTVIPASKCTKGVWYPTTSVTGTVYTTCAIEINKAGRYRATLVAEGAVRVVGSGISIGRGAEAPGEPAVVTASTGTAFALAAVGTDVRGQVVAPRGQVVVAAARATLTCGAVGSSLVISGAEVAAPMDASCLPR